MTRCSRVEHRGKLCQGTHRHRPAARWEIWLVEAWHGSPVNAAPDEHDAIGWFTEDELGGLCLAHDSYLALFTRALAEHRA
ncbi:hypothetical protein [Micromonospora sp. NPDC049102]|uniref:hypothetical protein n=1 Tax=Micromonospora sp. NPDC049102 TaxID=3364265 RepID=UPI0037185F97